MSVITNSIVLQIIKGIPPAPGDANSAESPIESLDLLDATGIGLLTEGWSAGTPALKNGGLWIESSISNGRALLGDAVGNVTETMSATCSSNAVFNRIAILKKLARLKYAASAHAIDPALQRQPVYLQWEAACAEGKTQYSKILNLEWSVNGDTLDANVAWDVTLTIEREHRWRGLWPGANPIEWTFQAQGKTRGITSPNNGYTYADMSLIENQDHFAYGTVQNRVELNSADYSKFLTKNWIDISNIPGDLPALVELAINYRYDGTTSGRFDRMFIARSTQPTSQNAQSGSPRPQYFTFNAGDADVDAPLAKAVDATNGVISNASSSTKYIAQGTIAAGPSSTFTDLVSWNATVGGNNGDELVVNHLRGKFMAFLRHKQTNGTAGDLRFRLAVNSDTSSGYEIEGDEVQSKTTITGSTRWRTVYMGTFTLPPRSIASVDGLGKGLFTPAFGDSDITLHVGIRNTTASTRTLDILDLVLIPIEESCIELDLSFRNGGSTGVAGVIIDNTGYIGRGDDGEKSGTYAADSISITKGKMDYTQFHELKGSELTLLPGVTNRLYFFWEEYDGTSAALATFLSGQDRSAEVRLNIVPCWSGVRDT